MDQCASTESHASDERLADTRPIGAMELLRTRRSPRLSALIGPEPSPAELRSMLEIASRVPDHGRLVPWRFIAIRGDRREAFNRVISDRFEEVSPEAAAELRKKMRHRMAQAPLVVAVVFCPKPHPKIPEWEQMLTAGAVCMNLLHAANAMGYAGLWLTEWYATDRVVLGEIGLTDSERLAGFIHLGTASEHREDRERPKLDELIREY
ncbi:MAG: nitroreductase [Planctomycetota bacterium]